MSKLFGWFSKSKKTSNEKESSQESEDLLTDSVKGNEQPLEAEHLTTAAEQTRTGAQDNPQPSPDAGPHAGVAIEGDVAVKNTDNTASEPKAIDASVSDDIQESVISSTPSAAPISANDEPHGEDIEATRVEATPEVIETEEVAPSAPVKDEPPKGFFGKLKARLSKTREQLGDGIVGLFRDKQIDDELFEDLETQLLVADFGVDTTTKVIDSLTEQASRKQLKDGEALYGLLKEKLASMLKDVERPLVPKADNGPFVILMVGVNGVGKTTTIGKLAKRFQAEGKSVMLAAGDTFRAAAVEQLQVWGERNDISVVAQHTGADSASVIFDAVQSAKAKGVDVLIADTAGRLQNKDHLMQELEKVVRVMKKLDTDAPHEILLTLDAGTGQNALSQARIFHQAVGLTGIALTKMDGTAKGGIIFPLADQFSLPIRYIGVGEGIDDLQPFVAKDFVDALFSESEQK